MKKLAILCFLLCGSGAAGQSIVCDLRVVAGPEVRRKVPLEGESRAVDYLPLYPFPVTVVQTFRARGGLPDTLELAAVNVSFWQQSYRKLFFHDMRVRARDRWGRFRDARFVNRPSEGRVSVAVPKGAAAIEVKYGFQPDFAFRNVSDSREYMQPYFPGWQSWYFMAEGMSFGDVSASVPKGAYCYGNLEARPARSPLFFCLFNGRFYERYSCAEGVLSLDLLLHKGAKTDTVYSDEGPYTVVIPGGRDTEAVARIWRVRLTEALRAAAELFGSRDSLALTVADAELYFTDSRGNRYPWGRGLEYAAGRWLLLVDGSMWKDRSVLHEAIHPFIKYAPHAGDSARYFFTESLTEYLAVRFGYESPRERDSVFAAKRAHYESVRQGRELSVFRLEDNSVALDGSGGGTAWVVYEKAPCALHALAVEMGDEAFSDALRLFFRLAGPARPMNMEDLGRCMTAAGGISRRDWEEFVSGL